MSKEVLSAIKAICEEKHIPVESVLATIEQALAAAYRKDFGNKLQNLKVEFNPENMDIRVFDVKTVVEDQELPAYDEDGNLLDEEGNIVPFDDHKPTSTEGEEGSEDEEQEERFNPKTMIMISEAKEIKKDVELGEELVQELEVPGDFGRMAAQTAKQVIIQRLREAEREVVYNEYKDKEGTLINGTVQRVERGVVIVDIGQATAIMPPSEQVRSEHYTTGTQLRFFIKSVATSSKGPEVIVSRADRELVRQLFIMEVPEITDGVVEIKALSREPGSRTKLAVHTSEENVDPVGSCVGQRGTRVQFVINELGGEKIDIIEWDEDDVAFIKNALSPAKIVSVELNEETREAAALVPEDQFSLAIGKQGQNVRLASSLTGWKIDIKQSEVSAEEGDENAEEASEESATEDTQESENEEEKKEETTDASTNEEQSDDAEVSDESKE